MDKSNTSMAQQIAQAAIAFEQRRTGNHVPKSVTVVLSEGTLVITLHDALSPAEKALARTPAGAAEVQEFHRRLFANSSDSLRQEINRITGMEVREATAEVEPASGAVVQAFTTGNVVQVFLLGGKTPTESWSGTQPAATKRPDPTNVVRKGFVQDLEDLAVKNDDFLRVLYTAEHCQLVLMALKPGEESGAEVHTLDQFFRVEEGTGEAVLDGVRKAIRAGFAVVVPAGTNRNIINTGSGSLRLYTLYAPPNHRDGVVHHTRDQAEADNEYFDGKTTE